MTKVIWMSDPHFQSEGTIRGLDPRMRLDTAIAHANAHYGDAQCIVLSGDLVGDDTAADYAAIAAALAKSQLPVFAMMGNNDERAGFRAHLPLPDDAMPDFVQYAIETPEGTLICLDTHKIGSHAGQFCATRQAWLAEVLQKCAPKPAYIFMHHPPLALGLPKQDEIMLDEADAFLDLISAHAHVKHLFMGHVHRTTCGTVRGIPFVSLGALSFQAPPPRPAWDWDGFEPAKEGPHYAVLDIENGDVTAQFIQFCDYSVGIADSAS